MSNQRVTLTITEQTNALKAIYNILKEYPSLSGMKVLFEEMNKDGAGLAVFGAQGAVYNKKFITGGFEAEVPFFIVYRNNPITDEQRINKVDYLQTLADWICEGINYPEMTDGRVISKIVQNTTPYRDQEAQNKNNDYIVVFTLTYRKDE